MPPKVKCWSKEQDSLLSDLVRFGEVNPNENRPDEL
jgi:hypothetical protein